MDVARRMHVHLPDRIVVKDLKGLHDTSVHRKCGGRREGIKKQA
jgi:hypothetical protein